MPKPYRVGVFARSNNAVMRSPIGAGVTIGKFAVPTVAGRKSGRPVNIPLVVFRHAGDRYLVAPYGVVNWVRNLRAAEGRRTATRPHHREDRRGRTAA
jgi:F420H(2)-dependent quinone reductase